MNLGIEDETLEFKKTTGELNEATNSICAMLNKHGHGTVYFGVLPNGEIKGFEINDSTLRDISRKIFESIVPQIIPHIEKKVFDGEEIIEVTFEGKNKPYSSRGVYYIRTADEDRVLPPHELRQLFEYNKESSWDKELTNYTMADISLTSFEKFYKRATACGRLKEADYNAEAILIKLGLLKEGKLTNAAYYLFSSKEPIVLKMAIFATDEKLTFLDINRIKGNIIDLIDQATGYVKEHMRWKADIVDGHRVETPEIPIKSLREIICNSFVHARYNASTEHEIDIHPSKVIIYNPGEFPIGYEPEDFVKENLQSLVRSPLILDTLYLSEDVESYSSGFKKVYAECAYKNVDIEYQKHIEGFSFIFKRQNITNSVSKANANSQISDDEKLVLELLSKNPNYSADEISNLINISRRSTQRIQKSLKDKGMIERVGGTHGYWLVKNK